MARIFVSYAREDLDKVSHYIADLQAAGFTVWWDLELLGGDDWSEAIEAELERSNCIVIFWSENSVNSPWVRIEAHYARQHQRLVPVRIDGVEVPDEFRAMQTIDATASHAASTLHDIRSAIAAVLRKQRAAGLRRLAAASLVIVALAGGYLYLDTGRPADRVPVTPPPDQPAWKALQQAATLEDIEQVEARFNALKASEPDSELAHAGLCATYLRRYELSRRDTDLVLAQGSCDAASNTGPGGAKTAEARGWLAYFTGDSPAAIKLFRQAISIDDSAATARWGLARAFEAQGDYTQAEQALREATVVAPGLWRIHNALAAFLQNQGRHKESIQRFELALQLAPRNISILNNLGVSYLFHEDYGSAISAWSQVLEMTPEQDHGATLTNIGSAYYLMRDFAAARIAFDKASRLLVDDYRAWGNLADTLAAIQDMEAAQASYRQALDRAQLILAQNKGDYSAVAAAASFQSALALEGWQNHIEEALNALPGDPEIRRLAALSFLRAGQPAEAKKQYAESLKLGYPEFMLEADYQFDGLRSVSGDDE